MIVQHKELAGGRWFELCLVEQMAHVGSEVERALNWKAWGSADHSARAFERALELLDLTIADPKHRRRLRELTRAREALADYFCADNCYGSSDALWRGYFRPFAVAARAGR